MTCLHHVIEQDEDKSWYCTKCGETIEELFESTAEPGDHERDLGLI